MSIGLKRHESYVGIIEADSLACCLFLCGVFDSSLVHQTGAVMWNSQHTVDQHTQRKQMHSLDLLFPGKCWRAEMTLLYHKCVLSPITTCANPSQTIVL
jgi:hypothetical protein